MIPIVLLDELAKFLKDVNQDYRLTDELVKNNSLIVLPGYVKQNENTAGGSFPHIMLKLVKGDDAAEGSCVTVKLCFGTYCQDATDGWRELACLMERTRQALLRQRTIAKQFRLELPLQYEVAEDQPFPEWIGQMNVKYSVGQPREELKY